MHNDDLERKIDKAKVDSKNLKMCPYCSEWIKYEASKCRFCAEFLLESDGLYNRPIAHIVTSDFKLSIVIPVYNEIRTLDKIVKAVIKVPIRKEIIIVDDFSDDGSREILNRWEMSPNESPLTQETMKYNELKILFHRVNQGKGAALRTGFQHAEGDVVLIQDADLEYDPTEYFRLLRPILDGKADVVYGSRFIGQPHRVLYFWHYVGNKIITTLSNMATNLNLTDIETCYKVFRRDVLKRINIVENRFGFEPEITAKIAKLNSRIYEIPISYSGRTYEEGKKITWKDGVKAIYCILKYGFR